MRKDSASYSRPMLRGAVILFSITGVLGCAQAPFLESASESRSGRVHAADSPAAADKSSADRALRDCAHRYWRRHELSGGDRGALKQSALCTWRFFALTEQGMAEESMRLLFNRTTAALYLQVDEDPGITWSPTHPRPAGFDAIVRSASFDVVDPVHFEHRPGWGDAVFGFRDNDWDIHGRNLYPPEGITRAFTLGYDARDIDGSIRIEISAYDAARETAMQIGLSSYPLNIDLVTPYAYLLERTKLAKLGRTGLLKAEAAVDRFGVYLLEPYQPGKIPVVMIHGLGSNPLIWRELTAFIFSDPDLRERFQVWHIIYPTGPPPFFNASRIRTALAEARLELDPELDDVATNNLVLVGHSMGGLVVRTFVVDSGADLWNATFEVGPEALDVTDTERARLVEIFYFDASPEVRQVFFIDTPHRGSDLADVWYARVGSSLIELPRAFKSAISPVVERNADYVTPGMRPYLAQGGPSSVKVLSPRHPLVQVLAEKPLAPHVRAYSVIGDDGTEGPVTDGVVTYESAYLAGVEDTIVVPSNHDSYGRIETLNFIKRHLLADEETPPQRTFSARAEPNEPKEPRP